MVIKVWLLQFGIRAKVYGHPMVHRPMVQAVSWNNLPQYPLQYLTVFNISITISFQYHHPIHNHSIPSLNLTIIIPNQVLHKSLTISNSTIHALSNHNPL